MLVLNEIRPKICIDDEVNLSFSRLYGLHEKRCAELHTVFSLYPNLIIEKAVTYGRELYNDDSLGFVIKRRTLEELISILSTYKNDYLLVNDITFRDGYEFYVNYLTDSWINGEVLALFRNKAIDEILETL